VKRVAFDETGNTGNDLITVDQPVFCLASVLISEQELARVEELLKSVKAPEWKFATMRRRPAYMKLLCKMLEMDWVGKDSVKIFLMFKRYMAITKLVDLIHEPSAREHGLNLYARGGARGLANLLAMALPSLLGQAKADELINSFVKLVRKREIEPLSHFHEKTLEAYDHISTHFPETIEGLLVPILIACREPEKWLLDLSETELDPLIPAYYTLADEWGKTLDQRFIILADESKTLARERGLLLAFADENLRDHVVGSASRNVRFPLKIKDLVATNSLNERSVQIADLWAGITGYAFAPRANQTAPDSFATEFLERLLDRVWIDGIVPSTDVTPEELGMEDFTGETPVDYSVRVLNGDPTIRQL